MTPLEYRTALTTLGLTQQAAGRWLRVSPKTAQNYAKHGPSGPAAVAVEMRLALLEAPRLALWKAVQVGKLDPTEDWVRSSTVREIAALKGEAG